MPGVVRHRGRVLLRSEGQRARCLGWCLARPAARFTGDGSHWPGHRDLCSDRRPLYFLLAAWQHRSYVGQPFLLCLLWNVTAQLHHRFVLAEGGSQIRRLAEVSGARNNDIVVIL